MRFLIIYEMVAVDLAPTGCTFRLCQELAAAGQSVELWVLPKKKADFSMALERHGIKSIFPVKLFSGYRFFARNRFLYSLYFIYWGTWSFFKISSADVVFTRDLNIAALLILLGKSVFYDVQVRPEGRLGQLRIVLAGAEGIIVKTEAARSIFLDRGYQADKMLIFRNRVSQPEFNIKIQKREARKKLGLPMDKKIIGYAGNLKGGNKDQGIGTALRALVSLDENYLLCLVGGSERHIEEYNDLADNLGVQHKVLFTGYQKHDLIPVYLKASDVLIAPYPSREHNLYYMSPVKLFEYMAADRPMITTDLAPIREILNGEQAILIPPDDPGALSQKIEKLASDEDLAKKLSGNALARSSEYSWEEGIRDLIKFIKDRNYANQ